MSVYTAVTSDDLDAWLTRYALGVLVEFAPIAAGIENTNYFVTTERGRWVLTLYERLPADELPFYLNLMAHLSRAGVEVPTPAADRTGGLLLAAERAARRTGDPHRRQRRRPALARSLRRRRQFAGAPASCLPELSGATHQPARPGMVAPGRARREAVPDARAERAARRRGQVPDRLRQGQAAESCDSRRPVLRQRAVPGRARRRDHRFRIRRHGFPGLRSRDRRQRLVRHRQRRWLARPAAARRP